MIYPASYDIVLLQNATWRADLRVTQERRTLSSIAASGGPVAFSAPCHKLIANDKVVFTVASTVSPSGYISLTQAPEVKVPCGLELNSVYYVLSSGLTSDVFYVSATPSGTALAASGEAVGTFYAAEPMSISGYTIDADISGPTGTVVASFVCSGVDVANGVFSMSTAPSVSAALEAGPYKYDVSLTSPASEKYYWLTGNVSVQRTYSR
jgi:hypothetical protein